MRTLFPTLLTALALAGTLATSGAVALAQDETPQRGGRLELVALNDLATWTTPRPSPPSTTTWSPVRSTRASTTSPDGRRWSRAWRTACRRSPRTAWSTRSRIKPGAMFAGPDFTPREVTAADVAYGLTRGPRSEPGGARTQLGWRLPAAHPGRRGVRRRARRTRRGHRGRRRPDPARSRSTAPSVTFLYGLTIATSWPVPPGGGRGARRGLRDAAGGRRPVPGPGVEQGLGHHARAQPGLRGPGAAVPRRDPRQPQHRREHPGPAPRVGRGGRGVRGVLHLARVAAPARSPTRT